VGLSVDAKITAVCVEHNDRVEACISTQLVKGYGKYDSKLGGQLRKVRKARVTRNRSRLGKRQLLSYLLLGKIGALEKLLQ